MTSATSWRRSLLSLHHKTSHEPKIYNTMAARNKLDLLTAVEQIVEKAKGTGLSSDFYRKADKYINVSSMNIL